MAQRVRASGMLRHALANLHGSCARRPWALPALALVLLALFSLLDPRREHAPSLATGAQSEIQVLGAIEPDPRNPVRSILRIQWQTFSPAEAYEVRFFSLDMEDAGRYPVGRQNSLTLDLQEVWAPVAPARALLWNVVALREGEDIASSALQTLRLP
jgi:hypothetical protein